MIKCGYPFVIFLSQFVNDRGCLSVSNLDIQEHHFVGLDAGRNDVSNVSRPFSIGSNSGKVLLTLGLNSQAFVGQELNISDPRQRRCASWDIWVVVDSIKN